MDWVVTKIKWIMLVSGVLTCSMLFTAIVPQMVLSSMFGETLEGAVADIVVRNWGALIGIVGVMLIYGAYHSPNRSMVLVVASVSKVIFISLVLMHGSQFLSHQAGGAVVGDALMVVLFVIYLMRARSK
ncbi:MAG TPA: hypothetical protein PLK30_16325 [Blastocatellia bacterium]|nr:hypothetical protein [Blastocatellia bacterium]